MKPDNSNTGKVEVANNLGADSSINKAPDLKGVAKSEAQPSVGSSVQPAQQAHVQQTIQSTGSAQQHINNGTSSGPNQFENQISQLPAEEADIIEKEWVDKVDEIVEKTSSDPYYEDDAHHALSRAYLKKRFNLDVE